MLEYGPRESYPYDGEHELKQSHPYTIYTAPCTKQ